MVDPDIKPAPADTSAPELRLPALYDSAGDLQIALERIMDNPQTLLTPGQIGAFNQILKDARELLPDSIALRDDIEEATEQTRPADLHHDLKTTLVPTLHNALPPDAYAKRG